MASKFALLPPQPFETTAELLAEVGLNEGQTAMAADDTTLIWIWLPFLVEEGGADTGWFEFASSARATKWEVGVGPPVDGTGNDNDLYLDRLVGAVYLNTAGVWGVQFSGTPGAFDLYTFDSATGGSPATGDFQLNASPQNTSTESYISATNYLGDPWTIVEGKKTDTLYRIQKVADPTAYLTFRYLGNIAPGVIHWSIDVVEASVSDPFTDGDLCVISWSHAGGLLLHQTGAPTTAGLNGDWCLREDTFGFYKKSAGSWSLIAAPPTPAVSQSQPSDPTGIASASGEKMLGLAGSITPNGTQVEFQVSGSYTNTNAGNDTDLQLRYGTGTAPTNGDAPTGTAVGSKPRLRNAAIANYGFALQAIVTGLTPGTAYWFDVACTASSGTSTVKQPSMTAKDIA